MLDKKTDSLPPLDEKVRNNMVEELSLALRIGAFYFAFLLAVPLLNWTAPSLMGIRLWGGLTLGWMLMAVASMVMALLVALIFVLRYFRLADKGTKDVGKEDIR